MGCRAGLLVGFWMVNGYKYELKRRTSGVNSLFIGRFHLQAMFFDIPAM